MKINDMFFLFSLSLSQKIRKIILNIYISVEVDRLVEIRFNTASLHVNYWKTPSLFNFYSGQFFLNETYFLVIAKMQSY